VVEKKQAGKDLMHAVVIFELKRLAVARLLVIPNRVYKWSINPFINPNSFYSHTHTHDNIDKLYHTGFSPILLF
jgi:hypothetical protein